MKVHHDLGDDLSKALLLADGSRSLYDFLHQRPPPCVTDKKLPYLKENPGIDNSKCPFFNPCYTMGFGTEYAPWTYPGLKERAAQLKAARAI